MRVERLQAQENIKITATEDVQYILIPKSNTTCEVSLSKEGVSVELLVPFLLKGDEDVVLKTNSIHISPNTKCTVNVKGVLKDAAKFDFSGKIIINKSAQQTVSYLEDNILVIGDKTKNYSQPILEIEADDVKASHGATTGRIDPEQMYYLMSRGLTKHEAEEVITEGYLSSVIDLILDENIKTFVKKELHA